MTTTDDLLRLLDAKLSELGKQYLRDLLDVHAHELAMKIRAADLDYWADKAADLIDPEVAE